VDSMVEQAGFSSPDPLPTHRLDPFGAQLLWRTAIRRSGSDLLDIAESARLAAEAEHLIQEWKVKVDNISGHEELDQFIQWRAHFQVLLDECDADDADSRQSRLLLEISRGQLQLPRHLVLAGMRELSPRQQDIINALPENNVTVYTLADQADTCGPAPGRFEAADRGAEWRAAIEWARAQMHDSDRKVAIVAANLQEDAAHARRLLHTLLPAGSYNVSVGRPLSEWPLMRPALCWPKLLTHTPPYAPADAGAALLAGHCAGHEKEAGARARIDARWRLRERLLIHESEWQRGLQSCRRLNRAWQQAASLYPQRGE